ncbi:MAG TPA: HAMP domain-containing sensor histidine kinase [Phycisphaerales bacterium]|nr:HAMP domain-containing sensor histidine kinase [Phycisphaerales bacterium]
MTTGSFPTARSRAAVLASLVFIVSCTVLGVAMHLFGKRVLDRELDENLIQTAESIASDLAARNSSRGELALDVPHALGSKAEFIVIRNPTGAVASFVSSPSSTLLAGDVPAIISDTVGVYPPLRTIHMTDDRAQSLRVATVPVTMAGKQQFFVQAGARSPTIWGSAWPSAEILLIAIPGGLLVAGLVGWMFAGKVLSPLREVTKAVEQIAPNRLEVRLPTDPHETAELSSLKVQFNAALERIQQGFEAQSRFISNVAHELKTPIATILAETQVIQMSTSASPEMQQYARNIQEEMRRVSRIVDSFLLIVGSERSARPATRIEVTLNEIVAEAVQHNMSIAAQYHVQLHTKLHESLTGEDDSVVLGDPELLRTMVENLVHNAIKFSPRGNSVDIAVLPSDGHVSITVRDHGPGIPPDLQSTILEKAALRAPPDAVRLKGLGLAVVRGIVDMHQGKVTARNCDGDGCVFDVVLPSGHAGGHAANMDGDADGPANARPDAANSPSGRTMSRVGAGS